MNLFAPQSFYLSYLLLLSSYLTMFMLQISLSDIVESQLLLLFLKEGIGKSDYQSFYYGFFYLRGDWVFFQVFNYPFCYNLSFRVERNYICLFALSSYQLSCLTCFLSSWIAFNLGSSFTTGQFVIKEALVAQVRVEIFS